MIEPIDIRVPAAPGSLMRSHVVDKIGRFRLCRRDCELYSVQIMNAGAFARATVTDGAGRRVWHQPSTFTGSFWLSGGLEGGLIVEVHSKDMAAHLMINWREKDRDLV